MNAMRVTVTFSALIAASCVTRSNPNCYQFGKQAEEEIRRWEMFNNGYPSHLESDGGEKSISDALYLTKGCEGQAAQSERYERLKGQWQDRKYAATVMETKALAERKFEREQFEKANPGVIRTADMWGNAPHTDGSPGYWQLNQLSGDWAIFTYRDSGDYPYLVAVTKRGLLAARANERLGSSAECMRFLGSDKAENLAGFPVEVRKFSAFRCHELQKEIINANDL